jgi:hypothetical protein
MDVQSNLLEHKLELCVLKVASFWYTATDQNVEHEVLVPCSGGLYFNFFTLWNKNENLLYRRSDPRKWMKSGFRPSNNDQRLTDWTLRRCLRTLAFSLLLTEGDGLELDMPEIPLAAI